MKREYETVPIPVAPAKWLYFKLPSASMQLCEWEQLLTILEAMRPALTYDPTPCDLGPGYTEDPRSRLYWPWPEKRRKHGRLR